MQGTTVKIGY